MRKIPTKYENPFDNILLQIADDMQHYFYEANFTPNHITTISIILCIISVYCLYNKMYCLAALLFISSYFFDCLDGNYARTYDMVTVIGDYYDHVGNLLKFVLLFYTFYVINPSKTADIIPIALLLCFLTGIHLSCQELYYNKKHQSSTLNILNILCPANINNNTDYLEITRFFGAGTLMLYLTLNIMSFHD